jgi:hypothetical protein
VPGERDATVFRRNDIEGSVGHARELEAGPGPNVERPHVTSATIVVPQRSDAAELRDSAGPRSDLGLGELATEQPWHQGAATS